MATIGRVANILARNDPARATACLLTLLSDEAGGQDISIQTTEVLQGVFHGKWNLQVKKLAYDLCKAVPISDEDILMHVLPGIKSDLASETTGSPEMAAQALRFLPHLPPHILAEMMETGEIVQMFEPAQCTSQPEVRGAAVAALGQVLLVPKVQQAAAKNTATAQQYATQWQNITDALLNENASHVVSAALASTTALLMASLGSSCCKGPNASPERVLLQRLAWAAAARVASALGPVLQMCSYVPHSAQVDVARMLLLVVGEASRDPAAWAGAGDPAAGNGVLDTLVPRNLLLPPLPVLIPSTLSHLAAMSNNRAGDVAVRLEACRAILKISAMVGGRTSLSADSHPSAPSGLPGTNTPSIPLPLGWVKSALEGLLDLEKGGMHLVEAGSHEIVGAAVEGLAVLPLGARQYFLSQLWPVVAGIRDAPTRMRLFATAWAAAVEPLHSAVLVNSTMRRIFEDAFLMKAITGEEGGMQQSAAQVALQAHQKKETEKEEQQREMALKQKQELKEMQQQQQQQQGANQAHGVEGSKEHGQAEIGQALPKQPPRRDPSPGPGQEPAPSPPQPGQGAGRLTATLPTKTKAPPRPPQGGGAFRTQAAPPPHLPPRLAKPPPNRPAGSQSPGGQLAAVSAAELERNDSGTSGNHSLKSGMLSMFKREKKNSFGLDAAHPTQQFDAPIVQAKAGPQHKQQMQPSQPHSDRPALLDKSASLAARPMQATTNTLTSIVSLGGMLGGGKDEASATEARQYAADFSEIPPVGVLRHEVACTLLGVVATQPAARAARELCREAGAAAAHDKQAMPAGIGGNGLLSLQPGLAHDLEAWLLLAGHTLQATKPCLSWEPLLAPAITHHLSRVSASHLSADFSTVAADMWLQLLMVAAATVPTLLAALQGQREQLADAKLMRAAADDEASDEDDGPLGLGLGEDDIDDEDMSSDSASDSGRSSSGASTASSSSSHSSPANVLANRGPRALRVGGVDVRAEQAKKQERARKHAQAMGISEDDWGEGEQQRKLAKLHKRKAKVLAKREARRPRTQLEKLMRRLEEEKERLDTLLKQLLIDWSSLNRALRPRVLWVVSRCIEMPSQPDQKWDLAIRVLQEMLCRPLATLAATRASELMASAANGVMYQSGRQGWPRDKPFTFDIAAASALCEGPDYDASSLVVGFTAAQHWTLKLQDAIAAAGRDPDPKLVEDVYFLAGRMDDMLRACLASSEAAGVPGLREWAKRLLRGLATIALYEPPAHRERMEADKKQEAARKARKERRRSLRRREGGGNEGSSTSSDESGSLQHDYQQEDPNDDSSSDGGRGGQRGEPDPFGRNSQKSSSKESSIDGTGGNLPMAMPPSLFMIQNMAKGKPPPPPPGAPIQAVDSEGLPTHGQIGTSSSFLNPQPSNFAQGTNESTDPNQSMGLPDNVQDDEAKKAAKARYKEAFRSRAATIGHGNGSIAQYMLQSGALHATWGYPFAWSPRAAALTPSRRARRARTLASHVAAALSYILKGAPLLPGLLPGSLGSQQLSPQSARARIEEGPSLAVSWGATRLDSPAFWSALPMDPADAPALPPPSLGNPGFGQGSQSELSGPGDPLLVVGSISIDAQDPSHLMLHAQLKVMNRTECDICGALMHVLVHGPALAPKRALIWSIPRLSPQDRASHSLPLRLLGYGHVELQVRLQLLPTAIFAAAALERSSATSASLHDISDAGSVPLHLACEPLRVSLVSHMLKPPQPSSFSTTPSGFFRAWSTLPARTHLSGICVWPGREGAALALSAMLRQPLTTISLIFIPASASYHAAFVGETALQEEVLIVVVGQLMPPLTPPPPPSEESARNTAKERYNFLLDLGVSTRKEDDDVGSKQKLQRVLGGTAGQETCASGRALFQIYLRTTSPAIVAAIEHDVAPAFVADLAPGCLELMGAGSATAAAARVQGQGVGLKPPLHPRVAALHAGFQQGVRALPAVVCTALGSGVGPLGGGMGSSLGNSKSEGASQTVLDVHAQGAAAGAKVSHKWMAEAALAEWQRLAAASS